MNVKKFVPVLKWPTNTGFIFYFSEINHVLAIDHVLGHQCVLVVMTNTILEVILKSLDRNIVILQAGYEVDTSIRNVVNNWNWYKSVLS